MTDQPGPPKNLRSLEAQIRNLARDAQEVEGRVRRAISVAIIGQLLADTKAGVIKGATNLELRLGIANTRASSDLDAVRSVALDEFRARLAAALADGWNGFAGRLVDRGEIGAPVPDVYRPYRYHAKLTYLDRPFGTVEIEVAAEEIDALRTTDTTAIDPTAAAWFESLGFPVPRPIPVLPLSHQIAQKLHACTTPDADGWVNDRSHDLVDLQLAMPIHGNDLAPIAEAAKRLFASRNRHTWPPRVTQRPGWAGRYPQEAADLPVLASLDEAIDWANELVAALDGLV